MSSEQIATKIEKILYEMRRREVVAPRGYEIEQCYAKSIANN